MDKQTHTLFRFDHWITLSAGHPKASDIMPDIYFVMHFSYFDAQWSFEVQLWT